MTDDRTIVSNALAGRAGGFELLVERHQALVWHVVYRMVSSREDAQDLVQEVFLRVYRRLGQFRFESSLATWIGWIAYSIAVRHLEKKRLPVSDGEDDIFDPDDDNNPEVITVRAGQGESVTRVMSTLAPLQRTIVSLYHLEELTVAEIARMVDLPAGTVKSHLFRARKHLKSELEKQEVHRS